MLQQSKTKPFRRQYKQMIKRGRDITLLDDIMKKIINEEPLPVSCRNHPLHGEWEGSYDCHIQGDWVLIYEIDRAAGKVSFQRTGTHSDLDL